MSSHTPHDQKDLEIVWKYTHPSSRINMDGRHCILVGTQFRPLTQLSTAEFSVALAFAKARRASLLTRTYIDRR